MIYGYWSNRTEFSRPLELSNDGFASMGEKEDYNLR